MRKPSLATKRIKLETFESRKSADRELKLEFLGCTVITTALPWESKTHLTSAGMSCLDLDVTDDDSIQTLAKRVKKLTGGLLHVLVNNA